MPAEYHVQRSDDMNSKTITILLVEGNDADIDIVCQALGTVEKAFAVTVARSLAEARVTMTTVDPDLVIIDSKLPDGAGTELLPWNRWKATIPFIVITNESDERCAVAVMRAGACDCVLKSTETLAGIRQTVEYALVAWSDQLRHNSAQTTTVHSDDAFFTFADQFPEAMYQTDMNGDCVFVNRAWYALTGMSAEDARGKGWIKRLHPEDTEKILIKCNERVKTGGYWGLEYRFLTPDGESKWALAHSVPMRAEDGSILGFRGTNIDITERKIAEEEFKKSEAMYRLLADNVTDIIWTTDLDYNYRYISLRQKKPEAIRPRN